MAYDINPDRLGKIVLNNIQIDKRIIDEPIFALYNMGRRLKNDCHWGEVYVNDVIGCNYRCAHCWVSTDALNGNINSDFIMRKLSQFSSKFKGRLIHNADDVFNYLEHKAKDKKWKVFAFTGGETSFYKGGLKKMAERARESKSDIAIGIDTNGWIISQQEDYLDVFDGLQEVMNFYVSIKGITPKSFSRFTEVAPKYYDSAFIAIEKLLRRGFKTIPGGIVLNTIAYEQNAEEVAEKLYGRLSQIHPKLPALVSYHKISTLVHNRQELSRRMKNRGYIHTKPSEFEKVLIDCFNRSGTPIIESLPENENIPGVISKDKTLQEIITDLRK